MRLSEFLDGAKERYHARAATLAVLTDSTFLSDAEVAAFVLFTPRQSYERAVRQWRAWRATGQVLGAMANLRKKYIDALPRGGALYRRPGEAAPAWANRLAQVGGLGAVKAPFLCSLLEPLEQVEVCLDVWMVRHYLRKEEASETELATVQGFHAMAARARGWRPFPYQWAIWDYVRSAGANGYTLLVRETDIAADLLGR